MVDDKKPKNNSALNVGDKRLQEWVEKLPQIILEEYRDGNVEISYTGTVSDYDDVVSAFEGYKDKISASFKFNKTADITDVEREIDSIFEAIKKGPVAELRDKKIIDAFEKAKNSKFEINVVATMSSGKSTLINALLGTQLMPAANEATTATIVKIVDTDQDHFSAKAFDKSGQLIKSFDKISLDDMKTLNSDVAVSSIEILGKIPFVQTTGMKLVLVDTPGPNNSRDKSHEEMTYKMIADSDKSLVLYVMNGQQLGINDEKLFLDYVCQTMQTGGKQGRERFIFAVNKMDAFKPKDEGVDCIERALKGVSLGLEDRGIYSPNIFPVSACAALELRTDDDEPMALDNFKRGVKKYEALHFDNYYHYSHLPQVVRKRIDDFLVGADDDEKVEIHTGIVSIEQAIDQYINKYARTTKVKDLVLAFDEKLKELSAVAHLEQAIRNDKDAKRKIEQQIAQIKNNIQSAQNAQKRSRLIDEINLRDSIEESIDSYIDSVKSQLDRMLMGQSSKVEKTKALQQCDRLRKDCESISVQIKVQIDKILEDTYKDTISKIVDEYKKYLAELNMGVDSSALSFNAVELVSGSLSDLSGIVSRRTKTEDESYYETRTKQVFVESKRKWYNPFSWFEEGDHYETRSYQQKIEKFVEYVDMKVVASEYLSPFRANLVKTKESAIEHVESETERLKEYCRGELSKIDNVLNGKLNALSQTEADNQAKAAEIAQKEQNLKWLEGIQRRVKNIIEF